MIIDTFMLNIALFSFFPLIFAMLPPRLSIPAFYSYMSVILLVSGLTGAIYSFPISDNLNISSGNISYGAFMMCAAMLIIVERDTSTLKNMVRLVVLVNSFTFLGFSFLNWALSSGELVNPIRLNQEIFHASLWNLIVGGTLILVEIMLIMLAFILARKLTTYQPALTVIYTLIFIVILCADGVLYPLLAFRGSPELTTLINGNVLGKLIIGVCYSIPILLFFILFRRNFGQYIEASLPMHELIGFPRSKLIETLYQYQASNHQLQQDKQELSRLALYDELTTLANRRKFNQTLGDQWSRCQREGLPLTVAIGDIDFFKQYNDTYGHQQGDVCLKEIALLWAEIYNRPFDLAARVGGEEFAVILPDTLPEQTISCFQDFLTGLQRKAIPHKTSHIASCITMSVGVAGCIPTKNTSPDELFAVADRNLYSAKNNGRNQVCYDLSA